MLRLAKVAWGIVASHAARMLRAARRSEVHLSSSQVSPKGPKGPKCSACSVWTNQPGILAFANRRSRCVRAFAKPKSSRFQDPQPQFTGK